MPLASLTPYIDWMPFFNAWEYGGKFPDVLQDPVRGESARSLYKDAQEMLATILREHWLQARAVVGFFPCNAVDEEIEVYSDTTRSRVLHRLHHLRQQKGKPAGQPHYALSDFIAPKDSGKVDYIGAFAVTAGIGIESHLERFKAAHDDYNDILLKSLADRLAEASAEALHLRVRRELWGYAPEERLTNEQLIAESYRGIRPAPGYPACPGSHREGHVVADARCRSRHRSSDHRELRDVSHGRGQRLVLRASGCEVLRGRTHRSRPDAALRGPQGLVGERSAQVAHQQSGSARSADPHDEAA